MLYEFVQMTQKRPKKEGDEEGHKGRVIEIYYAAKDAPALGAIVTYRGNRYKRIASAPGGGIVRNFQHVAINLPKHVEGAPHYDQRGYAAFETQREVDNFAAKFNSHGGSRKMKWD